MSRDFRTIVTDFASKKNWSITQLAQYIDVPIKDLYDCFKNNQWPQAIESKIMELFVEELHG